MVITKELQINRKLLDTKFEGYKLNPVPLTLFSKGTPDIDEVRPSDDQFSFLQQREFSLHNYLHYDPWNLDAVYVVNSEKQILKILYNTSESGLCDPFVVWEIPFPSSRAQGHSNITICFASENLVLVSNGDGSLHIISTSDRKGVNEIWKELHCESVLPGIRLTDARSLSTGHLHCLYCNVDSKQTYITHLYFLSDQEGRWKIENSALVSGKGSVDYAALDSSCKRAIVIGQIEAKSQEYIENENKKPCGELNYEGVKEISFEWQQNFDEIKVWIKCSDRSNTSVTVSSTNLIVKSSIEGIILQGKFYRPIEDNLSVWEFIERENQCTLEIILSKKDEGSMWTQLFELSEYRGKEIPNPDVTNEIHNRLSHLTSETEDVGGATVLNSGQLEECDMTDGDGRLLIQYDLTSPLTSPISKTDLGNGQWLMVSPRSADHPPQFCLRSDVDGLIYDVDGESPRHVATLCAFGFVQASKTSRIFSFLPSDLSYSGLVDSEGRVFIYGGGVRPSDTKVWGSQHIVTLGKKNIIGVHATEEHIFILSKNEIHLIKINTSN